MVQMEYKVSRQKEKNKKTGRKNVCFSFFLFVLLSCFVSVCGAIWLCTSLYCVCYTAMVEMCFVHQPEYHIPESTMYQQSTLWTSTWIQDKPGRARAQATSHPLLCLLPERESDMRAKHLEAGQHCLHSA